MSIKSYRDLDAWKVAMDLAVSVYNAIGKLPRCERFELASQMRRAAVSVPSNVAEGQAKWGNPSQSKSRSDLARICRRTLDLR